MNTPLNHLALGLVVSVLAGCAVGPDYQRPTVSTPAAYKETGLGTWKESTPQDQIAKGSWWELFGDQTLNELEQQATVSNQELKAAVARVTQARATARVAKAEFFPNLQADPAYERDRTSPNLANPFPRNNFNDFQVPVDFSYELDIWGRVRRSFEAATDEAKASVASYETVWLTLKAEVAQNYFTLRAIDAERAILRSTIERREQALQLAQSRYRGGAASDLDLSRAETELSTTESEYIGLGKSRTELENALAVLVGKSASDFSLAESPLDLVPPVIPPGLPSELLERRPDVAESERLLASQNARIGIAKAAFFPVVRLTGAAGLESGDISTLFNWQSRAWSLGPSISLPIFEGGRNAANLRRSKAVYEEAVAQYRGRILVAFQEVENGLSGLRILAEQNVAQARSVAAASRTADISNKRYLAGLVSYLEVVDSDRTKLQTQREAARILGQRLVTSVQLIKALGGGWADSSLRASAK
ncbi:MAG: efflux system, outer rane lipoprotein NodT family [Pedosphaera sp.]|nr:efflux system, outer rane lipoprotein NodT family [Pedosphaera sp.]